MTGNAEVVANHPAAADNTAYVRKYRENMERVSGSVGAFAGTYSVIQLDRVRGCQTAAAPLR